MFCLGCGTEMPVRATTCTVCGRDVAGAAGARAGAGAARVAPARTQESGAQPVITAMAPSPAAAARPALEMPGFPRDTPGRVLLLAVIGLAADLLAPWSNVYGQRQAMIHIGAPAVGLVLLFVLAALPLVQVSFRREPLAAMLPLVVGAFCAGIGVMYWVLLYRENEQASAIPASVPPDAIGVQSFTASTGVVIGPDIGLFLFLIGSAVLAVVGYQLFLAAAATRAASAAVVAGPVGQAAARVPTAASVSAPAPVLAPAPTSAAAGVAQGLGADQGLTANNGHSAPHGHMQGVIGAVGAASVTSVTDLADGGAAPQSAQGALGTTGTGSTPGTTGDGRRQMVLPGSAAWNEAPQQPEIKRYSGGGGWPRAHGRLR